MSQPNNNTSSFGQDEVTHLRSQNDQLWKIIEKQRVMIQNLQKDNVRLSAERDGLQDQVNILEKELTRKQRVASLLISPQTLREIAEQDDVASTPSSENTPSPIEAFSAFSTNNLPSPMPPPRSPYRALKDKTEDFNSLDSMLAKKVSEQEPESLVSEHTLNGRSSPGSPAPGPHKYQQQQRKDSAPLPTKPTPPIVPTPSKSSSSLEVRKNARQRESMLPPPKSALDHDPTMRAASPTIRSNTLINNTTTTNTLNTTTTATTTTNTNTNTTNTTTVYGKDGTNFSSSKHNLHYDDTPEDAYLNEKPASFMGNMSNVCIKVVGSNIKPNEKGKEVVSFIISVGSMNEENDDRSQFDERWRVEKLYSDFLTLDAKLKAQRNRTIIHKIGKLPDKALFSNNAPTKVDQRKIALEQYLQHLISLPLEDASDLCEFLSTNVVDVKMYQLSGQKEGYLTKRGKNFGGWKTRYFVLNQNILEYYESKEGTQLGSIRLTNAQIGTQMQGSSNDDSNSVYRHAFLIVEQKRVGSTHSVRHILCANSDDDRDSWVHALLQNINIEEDESFQHRNKKKTEKPRKLSKGEIRAISAQPISHLKLDNVGNADIEKLTSVPTINTTDETSISSESDTASVTINSTWSSFEAGRASLDQRGLQTPRQVVRRSSMGNLDQQPTKNEDLYHRAVSPTIISRTEESESEASEKKARNKAHRMTFWGKKMLFNNTEQEQPPRPTQSSSSNTSNGLRGFLSRSSHEQSDRKKFNAEDMPLPTKPAKQVFGVPLEEAVRISRVTEMYELPAVVYRCIEFLDAKNAVMEEGLYRLSGSNSTMKALRERFNQEGDVNLLASTKEDYDVHVVAGLLKMWLRELPTSVLTREHRMEFLHVIDLLDRKDRVNELGRLVSVLPLANYTLLRALTAHLIRVVQHSDVNKMTMRNVSIVFSPTLGIPATIFNLFMSEFDYIFWTTKDGDAAPRMIEDEEVVSEPVVVPRESVEQVEDVIIENHQFEGISRKATLRLREEHGRSNRNSVNYMDGAPNAIVDLEKNMEGPPVLDEDDDEDVDDLTLSNDSSYSLNS